MTDQAYAELCEQSGDTPPPSQPARRDKRDVSAKKSPHYL